MMLVYYCSPTCHKPDLYDQTDFQANMTPYDMTRRAGGRKGGGLVSRDVAGVVCGLVCLVCGCVYLFCEVCEFV